MALQSVGHSGFYNVIATKSLIILVGTLSVSVSILDLKPYFYLQLTPHLTIQHQYWRLFTSQLSFSNSGDFLFGSIILYIMRVIERQYGTSKYTAFLFVTFIISTFFELVALVVGRSMGLESIPGGPYALIFSSLYQYYRIIPVTYRLRIFGFTITDKMFLYVLAIQLAFSSWIQTLVPALCGFFAGALYRTDVGNIKQWRFPKFVQSLSKAIINPLFLSSPNPRSSATVPVQRPIITNLGPVNSLLVSGLAGGNSAEAEGTEEPNDRPARPAEAVREYLNTITGRDVAGSGLEPPSPEYTRMLMIMFPDHPREAITRALSSAHNDLNRSVEIMLNTPSPAGESSSRST